MVSGIVDVEFPPDLRAAGFQHGSQGVAQHAAPGVVLENMDLEGSYFASAEIAGAGFLNFRLNPSWYQGGRDISVKWICLPRSMVWRLILLPCCFPYPYFKAVFSCDLMIDGNGEANLHQTTTLREPLGQLGGGDIHYHTCYIV